MSLTANERDELAVTYAALILHDDGIAITADKLTTLTKAAGVPVQRFWPTIFAKALANRNIDDLISSVGGSGAPAAAPAAGAAAPAAGAPAAAAPKAEEKKEEKKEESDQVLYHPPPAFICSVILY
jgi:large subunit ribosomal protein LP1